MTPEIALQRAAALCAMSEQCSFDIRRKLKTWGLSPADRTVVLEKLIDQGFVDDARYAGAFVRDKVRFAGWGRRKIKATLATKGIMGEMATAALDSVSEEEWQDKMEEMARARAHTLDLKEDTERGKLVRFLATRGFEVSKALDVVKMLRQEQLEEEGW